MGITGDIEIFKPGISGIPDRDTVISLCDAKGFDGPQLTCTFEGRKFFIKYGHHLQMCEARTQDYFCNQIRTNPKATIRIPEIYHAFTNNLVTYIVMEHISIDRLATDAQRAKALAEIVGVKPPLDAPPGPIGGGLVKHGIFRDFEAPVVYKSVRELERQFNNIVKFGAKWTKKTEPFDFGTDKLLMYYSDLNPENFPVDGQGTVWVVDFGQAGVLPESFMSAILDRRLKYGLPWEFRSQIPVERSQNLAAMSQAAYWLMMCGSDFGLKDEEQST